MRRRTTRADRMAIAAANPKVDLAKAEEAIVIRSRLREALAPLRAVRKALARVRAAKGIRAAEAGEVEKEDGCRCS
jgi:hypothetical protein